MLWEGGVDDSQQIKARDDIMREVDVIEKQISLWRKAGELKQKANEEALANGEADPEEQFDQMVKDYLVPNEDIEMD